MSSDKERLTKDQKKRQSACMFRNIIFINGEKEAKQKIRGIRTMWQKAEVKNLNLSAETNFEISFFPLVKHFIWLLTQIQRFYWFSL